MNSAKSFYACNKSMLLWCHSAPSALKHPELKLIPKHACVCCQILWKRHTFVKKRTSMLTQIGRIKASIFHWVWSPHILQILLKIKNKHYSRHTSFPFIVLSLVTCKINEGHSENSWFDIELISFGYTKMVPQELQSILVGLI